MEGLTQNLKDSLGLSEDVLEPFMKEKSSVLGFI